MGKQITNHAFTYAERYLDDATIIRLVYKDRVCDAIAKNSKGYFHIRTQIKKNTIVATMEKLNNKELTNV